MSTTVAADATLISDLADSAVTSIEHGFAGCEGARLGPSSVLAYALHT
ncbi:hypothetical protein AB0C02_30970 [Micromonospora sp. NPDC048999]